MKMLFTIVIASSFACVVGTFAYDGGGATHETKAPNVTQRSRREPVLPAASFPRAERAPAPPIGQGPITKAQAAAFCDALDLVAHPELADDMLRMAGNRYGTPSGLLNGVWETESSHDIDGQTGSCDVMAQYTIRDCWKPGYTTKRPHGCKSPYIFVGETASSTRWKPLPKRRRVGNGTTQKLATARLGKALGFDPWSVRGSCGNRTLYGLKNPRKRPSHGGCFGNMQITPSEWNDDVEEMGYGLSELSPFNLCDSMLVASYRLRKHHDERLAKYVKSLGKDSVTARHDGLSWIWSARRYYGNPEGVKASTYEQHMKWGRKNPHRLGIFTLVAQQEYKPWSLTCGWACWDDMRKRGDFSPLIDNITWQAKRSRDRRRTASN